MMDRKVEQKSQPVSKRKKLTKLKKKTSVVSERKVETMECGFPANAKDTRTLKYSREYKEYLKEQTIRTVELDLFDEIPELSAGLVRLPKLVPQDEMWFEEEETGEEEDCSSNVFIVPQLPAEETPNQKLGLELSDDESQDRYDPTYSDWLNKPVVSRTRKRAPSSPIRHSSQASSAKRRLEEILRTSAEQSTIFEHRQNTTDEDEEMDEYFTSSDDEQ